MASSSKQRSSGGSTVAGLQSPMFPNAPPRPVPSPAPPSSEPHQPAPHPQLFYEQQQHPLPPQQPQHLTQPVQSNVTAPQLTPPNPFLPSAMYFAQPPMGMGAPMQFPMPMMMPAPSLPVPQSHTQQQTQQLVPPPQQILAQFQPQHYPPSLPLFPSYSLQGGMPQGPYFYPPHPQYPQLPPPSSFDPAGSHSHAAVAPPPHLQHQLLSTYKLPTSAWQPQKPNYDFTVVTKPREPNGAAKAAAATAVSATTSTTTTATTTTATATSAGLNANGTESQASKLIKRKRSHSESAPLYQQEVIDSAQVSRTEASTVGIRNDSDGAEPMLGPRKRRQLAQQQTRRHTLSRQAPPPTPRRPPTERRTKPPAKGSVTGAVDAAAIGRGTAKQIGRPLDPHRWQERFEQLKAFKEAYGHTLVPQRYHNQRLCRWAKTQREMYRAETLTQDRRAQLKEIGFEWECNQQLKKAQFAQRLRMLQTQARQTVSRCMSTSINWQELYEKHRSLAIWLDEQATLYRDGNLSNYLIMELVELFNDPVCAGLVCDEERFPALETRIPSGIEASPQGTSHNAHQPKRNSVVTDEGDDEDLNVDVDDCDVNVNGDDGAIASDGDDLDSSDEDEDYRRAWGVGTTVSRDWTDDGDACEQPYSVARQKEEDDDGGECN